MSGLLRSIGFVRSLKSVAETTIRWTAPKPYLTNFAPKNIHTHNARFLGVQFKSVRKTEGNGYSELNNLLDRLNTEGRQFGRISFNLFNEVLSQLRDSNSMSSSQALVVLRCCGALMPEELPAHRTEFAHSIWKILENHGLPLDLSHYNALLRVYVENEHDFSPSEFLERLKEKGIEPNRVTYQRLILRYAQLGDIEGATKILELMKEQNLPINETIFHALILGHARAGDLKNAKDMLTVMKESGLEPSVDTYLALAVGQAERGDISGVKSTIALSAEQDEALHDRDLMEVIYSLASKGHAEHVEEITKLLKKEWGYNQDCKNLIYRLLNAGCDDTARLVYSTMDSLSDVQSESNLNRGLFYVKHLVVRDKPLSSILSLCEDVSGNDVHLLQRSLEAALTRNTKLAYPLMDAIQAKGADLRPHFFWPLLARCYSSKDEAGVYEVLQNMKSRGVPITMHTMVDFALPVLMQNTPQFNDIIKKLSDAGLSVPDAGNSIARFLIKKGDLASVVEMLQQHRFRLAPNVRRDLALATVRTRDYWSAAALLSEVRVGRSPDLPAQQPVDATTGEDEDADNATEQSSEDVVGRFLLDVSQRAGSRAEGFDWVALLGAVKDRGLRISKELEASTSHSLGSRATPEVNALLATLASGTLNKVKLERYGQFIPNKKISVEKLEAELERCRASGQDPTKILTNLLIAYCGADEAEKAGAVVKELEETHEFPVGVGLRVHLINMYHSMNQPQLAFDQLEKIRQIEPDVILSSKVVLRLANLYVNAGRIEDAAVFLETEGKKKRDSEEEMSSPGGKDHITDLLCNRILMPSSENGDVEMVSRLERAILDGRFAAPSRRLLNPAVRAYLVKGDLESAWASVVECKRNYNIIPYRKGIAKELIQREDMSKLQQLVDMATDLYGEHASLFDLACYFVDEGRVKEAKRVLETPGLRVRREFISEVCQYYVREKQVKRIEDLLAASAGVVSIDRCFIYEYLLEAYINDENCEKALGLWTQMQEEDLPIPDKFLRDLGLFLQQKNQAVPFAIPEDVPVAAPPRVQTQSRQTPALQKKEIKVREIHPKVLELEKLLSEEKLDEAMALHSELASADAVVLRVRDSLALAGKLFDVDRLDDAAKIFQSPTLRSRRAQGFMLLRKLAARLAELGEYDAVEALIASRQPHVEGFLPLKLYKAALRSNQCERCFDKMEKMLDEALTPDDFERCSRLFSATGVVLLVNKNPSLLTRLVELSDKLKSKGSMEGVKSLWAYNFIAGNTEEVKKLSEELKDGNSLFVPVLNHCRDAQDVEVAQKFLSHLKLNPPADYNNAIAATYNCIIDLLCEKNAPQEALETLEGSLKNIELKFLHTSTLQTLSKQLAAQNIEFPFEIPGVSKAEAVTTSS